MKEEEDDSYSSLGGCILRRNNQDLEKEFINTYQKLSILWDKKHPDNTNKYRRNAALDILLKIFKKIDKSATRYHVRKKINILRSCFRKELRRTLASKTIRPDGSEVYEYVPKSWKYHALKFLNTEEEFDSKNDIAEVIIDDDTFGDHATEESTSENEELIRIPEPVTYMETESFIPLRVKNQRKKRSRAENHSYCEDDDDAVKEYEAIGANVSYKLRRMDPNQRCHAELLINKVLIYGLKKTLTDETDLTEVYKT